MDKPTLSSTVNTHATHKTISVVVKMYHDERFIYPYQKSFFIEYEQSGRFVYESLKGLKPNERIKKCKDMNKKSMKSVVCIACMYVTVLINVL